MTEIWRADTMRSFEGKVGLVTGGGSVMVNIMYGTKTLDTVSEIKKKATG